MRILYAFKYKLLSSIYYYYKYIYTLTLIIIIILPTKTRSEDQKEPEEEEGGEGFRFMEDADLGELASHGSSPIREDELRPAYHARRILPPSNLLPRRSRPSPIQRCKILNLVFLLRSVRFHLKIHLLSLDICFFEGFVA